MGSGTSPRHLLERSLHGSGLIPEDDDYYVPEIGYKLAISKSPKLSLIGSECLSGTEIRYLLSPKSLEAEPAEAVGGRPQAL